jgi:hypothetical protein
MLVAREPSAKQVLAKPTHLVKTVRPIATAFVQTFKQTSAIVERVETVAVLARRAKQGLASRS